MRYAFYRTKRFCSCVRDFEHDGKVLAGLEAMLAELAEQPLGNPKLQSHAMKGVSGAKRFISYIPQSQYRIIWLLANNTIVLLLFGTHDIEEAAARLQILPDVETNGLRIVEVEEAASATDDWTPRPSEPEYGQLFMAWTDDELARFGFGDHEIPVLRRLDEESELIELEPRMRADSFERAMNLVMYQHPDGEEALATRVGVDEAKRVAADVEQVVDEQEKELERAIARPGSRTEFARVERDELAEVLSKPIEDWMVFLHPDQVRLTERPFAGPARVRGPAGSGKTVVALHRARHLAGTYRERVLFTTYVTNLPPVFETLFARLAPDHAALVEFINLHKLAYRIVRTAGDHSHVERQKVDNAFFSAWRSAVKPGGLIDSRGYGWPYYREELNWVIKGRGLQTLDEYLALPRTGRGTPLPEPHRREVWSLFEAYEDELARRRTVDFNDLLLRALQIVEHGDTTEHYRAVVVDETQDLTEVGVRLAAALAGDHPRDGLFLVGDGQQSVYPGGYNLASIGIDVRGRSALLRTNYRNTREVYDVARRIVEERPFDDAGDTLTPGNREVICLRNGPAPVFRGFDEQQEHDLALVAGIDEAAQDPATGPGDIAVLVPTNALVREYERVVRDLGYNAMRLEQYDGKPNDRVKVGTYQRGKGLEFKRVFLPRLEPETVGELQRHNEDDETYIERLDLLRRQLFVAMTRARDGLWCGWVGSPSSLLRRGVHS